MVHEYFRFRGASDKVRSWHEQLGTGSEVQSARTRICGVRDQAMWHLQGMPICVALARLHKGAISRRRVAKNVFVVFHEADYSSVIEREVAVERTAVARTHNDTHQLLFVCSAVVFRHKRASGTSR